VLPHGTVYGILASAKGYVSVSDHLDLTSLDTYAEMKRDLRLVPVVPGAVVRLNNVFFDSGKAELKKESSPELNRIVHFMQTNPELRIRLCGHTDNVGEASDNLRLSRQRVAAVRDYLLAGIEQKSGICYFVRRNANLDAARYRLRPGTQTSVASAL
jgi:outer membrane protein OmpA-like peptidoglycan-associated protein